MSINNNEKDELVGEVIYNRDYSGRSISSVDDLDKLIAGLMIEFGSDGDAYGSRIIATIIWKILKEKK